MLELLRIVVDEVNTREHLGSLINGVHLSIMLQSESKTGVLLIENGKLTMINKSMEEVDVYIYGTEKVMEELLKGKVKLRRVSETKELELKSSLRASLLVESLFLLAKPDTITVNE